MKFYDAVGGGRSVGVPGTLRLLEAAYRRWGRLPWRDLFQPAIRLAEEGFAISPRLNGLLAQERFLADNDALAKSYFFENCGIGPPSSDGIAVLQILTMLEGQDPRRRRQPPGGRRDRESRASQARASVLLVGH